MWKRSDCVGQVPFLNLTSRVVVNNLLRRTGFHSSRCLHPCNLIRKDFLHVEKKRLRRSGSVSEPDITNGGKQRPQR